jgi:hypothetical protein
MDDSPYHAGEREVQMRAGVRERAEALGRKMIRPFMPDQHRQFFEQLPFVLVGSVDREGKVWASALAGRVFTPDERTVRVHVRLHEDDPLWLEPGRALGMLGIELPTRRRNRVNGRVVSVDASGFTLHVEQSFGNCPMYINARTPRSVQPREGASERVGALLPERLEAWIRASDTAFIASAADRNGDEGVDVSHRGGNPGFVRVERVDGATVLTMPDFSGNNSFNTLGNIVRYPHAGLSFPDFASGDWLALSCRAELIWGDGGFEGAQRIVRLTVHEGRVLPARLPFAWTEREPARQLIETGSWPR